jgi:hypothetical protein
MRNSMDDSTYETDDQGTVSTRFPTRSVRVHRFRTSELIRLQPSGIQSNRNTSLRRQLF